ncbi:MAG: M23 family metallopeptidase [Clostridiales bacterium]|nr:M23 family metallopeptidase [Clostridiales bacterium]
MVLSVIVFLSLLLQLNSASATNEMERVLFDDDKTLDNNSQVTNQTLQYCRHGIICEFDDQTMTLTNAYEGNRIEDVIADVESFDEQHFVEILYNGQEITEGELQVGMIIRIYHSDELFGEYSIAELKLLTTSKNVMTLYANANARSNEWILPVDNVNFDLSTKYGGDNQNGCVSCPFSSSHEAIDFYRYVANDGKAYGNSGRAIYSTKSGTVEWVQKWNGSTSGNQSYGHCILINHNDGTKTRYAHMQSAPGFDVDDSIEQGQIIGKVGSSGNSGGAHLHFEMYIGVSRVDPALYLHTYEYVWYEGSHPHENYEQCTTCGDLRSMGTYAATYEYTYYLTDHPHQQCGMCNICHIEKLTGERKTCNQVGIYASETHPHRRYRVYACGADEWLDSYGECNQVGIYVSETHPHRRYRVYACGADEWLDSYGECNQVGIYVSETHPHRRYRVYACGADEWLDSYGECNQVGIYASEIHPHRRYRVYACGADEWLDSYGTCTCK